MTNFSFFRISKVRTLGASALLAFAVLFASCDSTIVSGGADNAPAGIRSAKGIVGAGTGTITPVTISGTIGSAIASQTLTITLAGNWVNSNITLGTNVTDWFFNLPKNLTAEITTLTPAGGSAPGGTIVITVFGTPVEISSFWIAVTIPESDLTVKGAPLTIDPVSTAAYSILWPYTNWTQSSSSPFRSTAVNAVAYGDGIYLISSYADASAAYSTTGGASWLPITAATTGMGTYFPYILFVPNTDPTAGTGTFYAVGASGTIRSTTAATVGSTWTPAGSGLIGGNAIRGIAYNATQTTTIIVGDGGQAAWLKGLPTSGAAWTPIQFPNTPPGNINSVATAEIQDSSGNTVTVWVVVGQDGFSAISYGNNPAVWVDTSSQTQNIFGYTGGPSGIKQVAYKPEINRFVAVGYARTAYIDFPNAVPTNWTGVSVEELLTFDPSRTAWLNAVIYSSGKYFVAGGSRGVSIASVDGVNWAITGAAGEFDDPDPDDTFVNNIAYSPNLDRYLIGGGNNIGPGVAAYNN